MQLETVNNGAGGLALGILEHLPFYDEPSTAKATPRERRPDTPAVGRPGNSEQIDDLEWVNATLEGDTECFENLVRKYQAKLFALARRYFNGDADVEDVVQQTFIKAFQKLSSFRREAPFEHWLTRLAVRTCLDAMRKRQCKKEVSFTTLSPTEQERRFCAPSRIGDSASEARELVRMVLNELSPSARLVITLLELEDRSVREISDLTGWSIPTVKIRAFRARARMRRILESMLNSSSQMAA